MTTARAQSTDVPVPAPAATAGSTAPATTSSTDIVRRPPKRRAQTRARRGWARVWAYVLPWLVPVVLIGLWQVAAVRGWIDTNFFPAPSSIWSSGVKMIENGTLWDNAWISTKRVLESFALGVVSGVGVGLAMGASKTFRNALEPTLNAFYTVPKLALLPLFLLVFGIGEAPLILVISITVFFFMWISTMAAVLDVSDGYQDALRTLGANRREMYRHVIVPAILPQIFIAMRVSAGVSILTMVGVEFVQAGTGIGYLIWHSWGIFLASEMYVGIVTVALMGVGFIALIQLTSRLVLRWKPMNDRRTRKMEERP